MEVTTALLGFVDAALAERKYADSTARGLKAAVKLFEPYLNNSEQSSFEALLENLDNIANDIYAKQKDGNTTVTTLLVYKRRMAKLARDYQRYGTSPAAMASWNPRRLAPALGVKKPEEPTRPEPAVTVKLDTGMSRPTGTGISVTNAAGEAIAANRSEIYLRPDLKVVVELPIDVDKTEAARIKQFIDLMVVG